LAEIYDKTDAVWTSRGDFAIHAGDLADTKSDPLRSLYQEIKTRVKSELGEWYHHRKLGATLSDFVGEPNDKTTAEAIKLRIIASLTNDGFVKSSDLKVTYMPVDLDRLFFRLSVSVAPTARNAGSNVLKISLLYHYSENNIFVK